MEKPLRYYELHAEVCKTFGHPKRLMVISALRNQELTVTEIAEKTNIDVSNLSQHLHLFRDKGLVTTRREGTKIFYKLSHPNIGKALDLMSSFLEQRISRSHDLIKES
jgi:ArsR family transcriptional regulator